MNLLRAQMRVTNGWWEIQHLDLEISADGPSEEEMLREVEHSLPQSITLRGGAVERGLGMC